MRSLDAHVPDGVTPELTRIVALVREGARRELLPRFGSIASVRKADGSVVTEADRAIQSWIEGELVRRWPAIPVLAEEMGPARQRAVLAGGHAALWCMDPLDGTSNFAAGTPFFCVSLALIEGNRVTRAVVYDPVRDECFAAAAGHGAWCNGADLAPGSAAPELAECIAGVDFKRLASPLASRLAADPPFRSQRNFGAAALDWCWVAMGRYGVYLHGGQQLWDFAAGSLILAEAGGGSCTLDGATVFRPELGARSVVAARDACLLREWRAWLGVPGDP
ncbi:MAG: hypothetical protein B7Z66_06315 [Chromatiales bacterium 21-64-14]|nr:MAG: hypothetical protein B7Z66_06315 [Chromatiales bacterium 21-64-14]HQU15873.1 inositol monophosphatase family protein [Gammaproteobacteria bacterium]